MLKRTIPSTGESLSAIGLGTWQTFDVGDDPAQRDRLADVLNTFVELGGTVVDSSPMYGRAEQVVGDLAARLSLHGRLFLATKVWTSGRAVGITQMESSFEKMRSPRLDLLQVHNLVDVDAHLDTLEEWKAAGRVRYVGITHYQAGGHAALVEVMRARRLDFVQVNYSAVETQAAETVLPVAQERGIAVLANRPFAEGKLLKRLAGQPLPECARELDCQSWPELLIKFVLAHEAITCVIPATSSVAHLRANMRAGSGPLPDARQRAAIVAAVQVT
jgi:aryl-alcohol dehydrogenase-like predicted oxidoreductase